jgi:transposase
VLIELGVVEQRHKAVPEVMGGLPVTEVAGRYGVTRQTVHRWLRWYAQGGIAAPTAPAAPRPARTAWRPRVEARIVALRTEHPGWGPRTLLHCLGREGVEHLPGRFSVHRRLLRHRLIEPQKRRRKREDYRRWERLRAMELWQMDVMGGVRLTSGGELKVVTGIDDHSRFCVCAQLTPRATARPVCEAFLAAMRRHGAPEQVLTTARSSRRASDAARASYSSTASATRTARRRLGADGCREPLEVRQNFVRAVRFARQPEGCLMTPSGPLPCTPCSRERVQCRRAAPDSIRRNSHRGRGRDNVPSP